MDRSTEVAVKLLASRQGGVFSLAQAVELGMSRQSVWRRCRWGSFDLLHAGVFRDVAVPITKRTRWFGAILSIGREAALAVHSACSLHGLSSTLGHDEVHVVVRCTCRHDGRPGIVAHRSLTLQPHHVTVVDGLAVTTMERTLCDVASRVGPVRLRRLLAESVRRNLTSPGALRRTMDDAGRFNGKVMLRELVDQLSPLEPKSASALESEFLQLVTSAGLPPTAVNHAVVDAEGRIRRIDAVYLPQRLPIELDSRLFHGSLLDWHDDLRRENAIALSGWLPFLRFNWHDVTARGHLVVETIRRALDHATT